MQRNKTALLRWLLILTGFVLILAFRSWYAWRHSSFGQDIARDLILTQHKLEQGQWLVGYGPKASVGDFYLPPFYYQLHLLLSNLTNNYVWTMKWWVLVIEALTPIVLYFLLKELCQKRMALALSGLYVIAALPTIFGSFAWNPNTIPFFSTVTLYAWVRFVKRNELKWLSLLPLSVAIACQLHYQAAVLVPFVIFALIFSILRALQVKSKSGEEGGTQLQSQSQAQANSSAHQAQLALQHKSSNQILAKTIKFWFLGLLLAILTIAPYFYAEFKHNWTNTNAIINYFQSEHSRYYNRVSKPDYILTFLPAFIERVLVGRNQPFKFLGRIIFFLGFLSLFYQLLTWIRSHLRQNQSIPQVDQACRKDHSPQVNEPDQSKLQRLPTYFLTTGHKKALFTHLAFYFGLIFVMLRLYKGDKIDYYLSTLYILPIILLAAISQIGRCGRKVATALLLVAAFLSGRYYAQLEPSNQLLQLKQSLAFIEEQVTDQSVALLFHNDDYINAFAYGVERYSDLTVDQQDLDLVEVCAPHQVCHWNGLSQCRHGRAYSFAALIKATNDYQQQASYQGGQGYKIVVGRLQQAPIKADYQLFTHDLSYGSDLIKPEWYFYGQAYQ